MREYAIENGAVDSDRLTAKLLHLPDYQVAHEGLVIPCHDAVIKYDDGFLLVNRKNHPAKDMLWFLGGRIQRGISTEDSLRDKIRAESGLELDKIAYLGTARTFFQTDPFGHGRGTDTINLVYLANGYGNLNLDGLHEEPTIVTSGDYLNLRDSLHPYVRDFMDKVISK